VKGKTIKLLLNNIEKYFIIPEKFLKQDIKKLSHVKFTKPDSNKINIQFIKSHHKETENTDYKMGNDFYNTWR
jgi:hypothetical protein